MATATPCRVRKHDLGKHRNRVRVDFIFQCANRKLELAPAKVRTIKMITHALTQSKDTATPTFSLGRRFLLQRKYACGSLTSSLTGECADCKSKKQIQAKLTIGASNDPLEREADRVADQVLAAPAHSAVSGAAPRIQRFTGQATGQTGTAPASVDGVLAGSGRSLDPALQQDMGQRFGHDFSRVRVHSGAAAEQSARGLNAQAYTVGRDIVFGTGRFAPETSAGRRLIAHELTHVLQQTGASAPVAVAGSVVQRQPASPDIGGGILQPPAVASIDLRGNASPLLASALGSTTVDRFALGSAAIPKTGEGALRYSARQILYFMRQYPRSSVHLAGHTDRVGTDERNLTLGQERADAVSTFLQKEGVPAEIISTESKGEIDPLVPTINDQAEPRNRRVNVFFRVGKSTITLGLDKSLELPSPDKEPQPTPPSTPTKITPDFDSKPRITYRDPADSEWWKRAEENQRMIEEYDSTHPRENKSVGDVVIDGLMNKVINPILRELPLSKDLRKKVEEAIRGGLESGTEKACEAAIDALQVGGEEKDALKAACKAALKQKPGADAKK